MTREAEASVVKEAWAGGCFCGGVRYRVVGELDHIVNCHCHWCRRFHGHLGAYTRCPKDRFTVTSDRGLKWWRQPDDEDRGFCETCGSSLFGYTPSPELQDFMYIAVGTLDDPDGLRTTRHMFVSEKPDYYEIADDLPQLQEHE